MRIGGVKLGFLEILFLIAASLILCLVAPAQTTAVTATITDTDGQTWNNGHWSATLYNPFPANPPSINGTPLTANQLNLSGTISNSGVLTGTFSDNSFIAPTGTQWYITICANANVQCATGLTSITGTTANLSTLFSSYTKPIRIPASWQAYMYRDSEVYPIPVPGGRYWNVTSLDLRCWNGSSWNSCGGGGGSGCTLSGSAGYILIDNGAGGCEDANNTSIGVIAHDIGGSIQLIEDGGGVIYMQTTGGFDFVQQGGTPGDIDIRNTSNAGDINIRQEGGASSTGGTFIQNDAQGGILIENVNLSGPPSGDILITEENANGDLTLESASTLEIQSYDAMLLQNRNNGGITLDSDFGGVGTGPINLHAATTVNIQGPTGIAGGDALKQGTSPNSGAPPTGYVGFSAPVTVTNPYWIPIPGDLPGAVNSIFSCVGASSPLTCSWSSFAGLPAGTPTFSIAAGGSPSIACAGGYVCTNSRGELAVDTGTGTVGTFITVTFSTTLSAAPFCTIAQNTNGGAFVAQPFGHTLPSTTAFQISTPTAIGAATFFIDYVCQP